MRGVLVLFLLAAFAQACDLISLTGKAQSANGATTVAAVSADVSPSLQTSGAAGDVNTVVPTAGGNTLQPAAEANVVLALPEYGGLSRCANGNVVLTVRQLTEAHVANPTCAACHNSFDPMGFSVENFDAIGRFRTQDANQTIDASGTLSGGQHFCRCQRVGAGAA